MLCAEWYMAPTGYWKEGFEGHHGKPLEYFSIMLSIHRDFLFIYLDFLL